MMFRLMQTNPSVETPLVQAWQTGVDDLIVLELQNISKQASWLDRETISSDVLDILRETMSARVRNASALALVDLGVRHKTEQIADVLKRKDIAKVSGTLLYSLNEIDAYIPLSTAIDIVESGSFEARNEVVLFIEDGRLSEVSEPQFKAATDRLRKLVQTGDKETIEAASYAADCLADHVKEQRGAL